MRPLILAAAFALAAALTGTARAQDTDGLPLRHAADLTDARHVVLTAALAPDTDAVAHADAVADRAGGQVVAIWPLAAIDLTCYVIRLPDGVDPAAANAAFLGDPDIRSAQQMTRFDLLEARYADELVPVQDSLRRMNVLAAHDVSTGAGVTVALIDSAVDTGHRDLSGQDIVYRDLVDPSAPPGTAERHGTAMAGLIAADAANGVGMVGVAPDVRLLALRACWSETAARGGADGCNTFSLARALNLALLMEADIISLSLGGPYDALIAALIAAAESRGVVVIAAHGPGAPARFPASEASVIAATADGPDSAHGAVVAPGRDVISAEPGDRYDFFSGDSVASAHVSGITALLMADDPDLGPSEIRQALLARPDTEGATIDACALLQGTAGPGSVTCY